jgi:hypothetical protein
MSYRSRGGHTYGNQKRRSSARNPHYGKGYGKIGNDIFSTSRNSQTKNKSIYNMGISIATKSLIPVLCRLEPTTNLLYTGYTIADKIYENLNTIQQLIGSAEEGDLTKAATSAISLAGNIVTDTFADVAWSLIEPYFQGDAKTEVASVFKSVFSDLTMEEIDFATGFVENHGFGKNQGTALHGDNSKLSRSEKLPKDKMNYV